MDKTKRPRDIVKFETPLYIVTELTRKTSAVWFKDVEVGDVVQFSVSPKMFCSNEIKLVNLTQNTTHLNQHGQFYQNIDILKLREVPRRW